MPATNGASELKSVTLGHPRPLQDNAITIWHKRRQMEIAHLFNASTIIRQGDVIDCQSFEGVGRGGGFLRGCNRKALPGWKRFVFMRVWSRISGGLLSWRGRRSL